VNQPHGGGRTRCRAEAWTVLRRLVDSALWHDHGCTWLTASVDATPAGRGNTTHNPIGADLYAGTSGVALVLARASKIIGDERMAATAVGAISCSLHTVHRIPRQARLGYFAGWSGIAAAAVDVGARLEHPRLSGEGLRLLTALRPADSRGEFDLVSGCAGTLLAISTLPLAFRDHNLVALGEEIVDLVTSMTTSRAGIPKLSQEVAASLAHGLPGIAFGLLEFGDATRNDRALTTGLALATAVARDDLRHERPAATRRADELAGGAGPRLSTWCYGACGRGLLHLRAHLQTGEALHREAAEVAAVDVMETAERVLRAGATAGVRWDFSLCHGLAGSADFLLTAADVLGSPVLSAWAMQIATAGTAWVAADQPWPCGADDQREPQGLMLGLAGIALLLLRLSDPRRYPPALAPMTTASQPVADEDECPAPVRT
jgi:lantibiotic modifying enzyme